MHTPHSSNKQQLKKLSRSPIFIFIAISLIAFTSFIAGTRVREWQTFLDPVLGINRSTDKLDLSSIQQTYQTLEANYDGKLDTQKLIDGANQGLVSAAGDKFTVYLNKADSDGLQKDLNGDVGAGIGAVIAERDGQPTITKVLNDNPAKRAGIQAGSTVIKINGESAKGWSSDKAASKIRGEQGTTVKLVVSNDGVEKEFSITREKINNPSVETEIKDGVGLMTISRFDEQTSSLARQAAENFKAQGVQGVIVDVRSDGGGYLDAAVDTAGLWLDNKLIVTQKKNGIVTDQLRSKGASPLKGIKTVVLVNAGTASASEILAAALRDNGAATLVGEKTFGKGSVQQLLPLQNDAMLKVTVSHWYTPNDKNVTEKGLVPDFVVGLSDEDVNAGRDPQLEKARNVVK